MSEWAYRQSNAVHTAVLRTQRDLAGQEQRHSSDSHYLLALIPPPRFWDLGNMYSFIFEVGQVWAMHAFFMWDLLRHAVLTNPLERIPSIVKSSAFTLLLPGPIDLAHSPKADHLNLAGTTTAGAKRGKVLTVGTRKRFVKRFSVSTRYKEVRRTLGTPATATSPPSSHHASSYPSSCFVPFQGITIHLLSTC
jgi:hypothetical protein